MSCRVSVLEHIEQNLHKSCAHTRLFECRDEQGKLSALKGSEYTQLSQTN